MVRLDTHGDGEINIRDFLTIPSASLSDCSRLVRRVESSCSQ